MKWVGTKYSAANQMMGMITAGEECSELVERSDHNNNYSNKRRRGNDQKGILPWFITK